ncbi:MAG: zinc-binding dehydrogenase [Candidatus Hodarchaeota archaeon]
MKAAVIHKKENISVENVETPQIEPGKVLVKIKAVRISPSDIDLLKGTHPLISQKDLYPVIPGNQWSGIVAQVGEGVIGIEKGERVVGDTAIGCGKCTHCRTGNYHLCFSVEIPGLTLNGGMAEYILVPASMLHPFTWITYDEAALIAPITTVLHAIKRAEIPRGLDVLIWGSNPIALAAIQLIKVFGASRVFVGDLWSKNRLQVAKKVGADIIVSVDPDRDHLAQIRTKIKKRFVNVVFETSGSPEGIPLSLNLTKRGGRLLFLTKFGKKSSEFDLDAVILKELTLFGISEGPGAWDEAITLVNEEKVKLSPLITHKFKLNDLKEAFDLVQYQMDNVIAALITF